MQMANSTLRDEAIKSAEKMEKKCRDMEQTSRRIREDLQCFVNDDDRESFDKLCNLRINLYLAARTLDEFVCARSDAENGSENHDPLPLELAEKMKIDAVVSEGKLLVRLPLLFSRYTKKAGERDRYQHWFCEELMRKLDEISGEIPTFFHRHCSYLFAVSAGDNHVTDNDNYDTKAITDTLMDHFFGGDSALSTSFSYASFLADPQGGLAVGTYIIISGDYAECAPLMQQMELLKRAFGEQ